MRISLLALLGAISGSLASSGDRSPVFADCVAHCQLDDCQPQPPVLPLTLRLTGWTCRDNCEYGCMHHITTVDVANGRRVQQYFGKWPFWRFVGMQEPASVLFSLLNLYAHAKGFLLIRRQIPGDHPMRSYYIEWALASMNAWIWSAFFHTRDLPNTERLDYFSAALAILFALYFTVIRMFHLYPATQTRLTLSPSSRSDTSFRRQVWTSLCCALYLGHVLYLSLLPRFDYTYNMIFNVVIGLTHNLLWTLYSLPVSWPLIRRYPNQPKTYRPAHVSKAALFVALTTAATALELFDFPPLARIIDAHALWHLSTAPISWFWYQFLVEDALDGGWRLVAKP